MASSPSEVNGLLNKNEGSDRRQKFLDSLMSKAVQLVREQDLHYSHDFFAQIGRRWRMEREDAKTLLWLMDESGFLQVTQHGRIVYE
jgi:hypothetical protein